MSTCVNLCFELAKIGVELSENALNALGLIEAWLQECRVKIFTCENIIFESAQIGVDIPEK